MSNPSTSTSRDALIARLSNRTSTDEGEGSSEAGQAPQLSINDSFQLTVDQAKASITAELQAMQAQGVAVQKDVAEKELAK